MTAFNRRTLLRTAAATAFTAPFWQRLLEGPAVAAEHAKRVIFFYYPDGVAASSWHAAGSEHNFTLSAQQQPLSGHQQDCLFFTGLSMGPADGGSHPGGAKKLLTGHDGGRGESIDQFIARTVGASAPHRHVYLGAMANQNNASGDKHVSYVGSENTIVPEDSPRIAFQRLFSGGGNPPGPTRPKLDATVIDGMLEDLAMVRSRIGAVEQRKLDRHLESLREVEARIKAAEEAPPTDTCAEPPIGVDAVPEADLYAPERFPEVLRLQTDLMVTAMACGLSKVGVIQASHHTSELIMSRFPGTEMTNSRDMRSHEASHYGGSAERLDAFTAQRRWFVGQLSYLLDQLASRPEADGTMLDYSLVLFCTEVGDGNDHQHDNMPLILAGRGAGQVDTGRLLHRGYERHGNLLVSIARAIGSDITHFGDASSGPLSGLTS